MKRFFALFLALSTALLIAGCFDYDEVLELNADGSGTLALHLVVYKHYFEEISDMMSAMSEDSTEDSSMFTLFKREDLEKELAKRKSTVKLIDFKEQVTDSTVVYDVKYAFTDLQEMMAISEEMGRQDMMAEEPTSTPKVAFAKDKAGLWRFSREFEGSAMSSMMPGAEDTAAVEPPSLDTTEATDSLSAAFAEGVDTMMGQMGSMMTGMVGMMTKAFGDHRMRMTVKFPGTVTESNATKISGNTAIWEYKFVDMGKAPKQLEAVIKP
jgi:hypothetical protein